MDTTLLQWRQEDMPRAASLTHFRSVSEQRKPSEESELSFQSLDDEGEPRIDDEFGQMSPPGSTGFTTPDEYPDAVATLAPADVLVEELKKVPSARTRRSNEETYDSKSSFDSSLRHSSTTSLESARTASTADTSTSGSEHESTTPKPLSSRFSRHAWHAPKPSTPSRSSSPSSIADVTPKAFPPPLPPPASPTMPPKGHIRKKSLIRGRDTARFTKAFKLPMSSSTSDGATSPKKSPGRKSTLLKKRPMSGIFRVSTNELKDVQLPDVVPMPPPPQSFSTEKLPIVWSSVLSLDRGIPSPRLAPPDRSRSRSRSRPNTAKKDELWSVFRSLEGDYAKFAPKSSTVKSTLIRDSLLPFLRGFADHPSNENLRPEDLERRANILNMWWTGLLEMLQGNPNLVVSGADRPIILEGVAGIMERPEWRQAPSPFSPLSRRGQNEPTPNHSTTSLTSSTSDFLAESVHHHVRTMFIQNLTNQMTFVVNKMSLRNASASLVMFSGKACAYAFMFVPGMAETLVRLWNTPKETVRRVVEEHGMGKMDRMSESVSQPIVSAFPPALQQLAFVSLATCMRRLRMSSMPPPGTADIAWRGRWLERWRGHESDLFYVFVKHFHILASDFLLPDTTPMERLCIPGLVLVHAQTLVNLDASIHRDTNHSPQQEPGAAPSTTTFDDLLADPDAIASTIPLVPNTAVRNMAENRLVMLIRDFLSERTAKYPRARQIFAESANAILQSAARNISVFDQSACTTLLDFMEEALVLLVRYEQTKELDGALIKHEFWLEVCRRMLNSESTTTEIRLYAFLYTAWNSVASDWRRKASLCIDFLLERSVFEGQFNHWCPMVRAYYMRLLCWRVLRYDGEEHDGDLQILETVQERLQETWLQYLTLRQQADLLQGFFPTSNPCNPAPGRRLLIMRTDHHITPENNNLTSFDGVARLTRADTQPLKRRTSGNTLQVSAAERDDGSDGAEKGFGGFLRKMVGVPAPSRTRSRSPAPPSEQPRAQNDPEQTRPAVDTSKPLPPPPPRPFTFRFSLEPQHHHHHHHHHPHHQPYYHRPDFRRLSGNPAMRLQPPRLPAPAEAFLRSRLLEREATTAADEPSDAVIPRAPLTSDGERYCGRALAEWTMVVGECQSFFERRRNEGVPCDRLVETPNLGVEVLRKPS